MQYARNAFLSEPQMHTVTRLLVLGLVTGSLTLGPQISDASPETPRPADGPTALEPDDPVFEGFRLRAGVDGRPESILDAMARAFGIGNSDVVWARATMAAQWTLEAEREGPFGERITGYAVRPRLRMPYKTVWHALYTLRKDPAIASSEIHFRTPTGDRLAWRSDYRDRRWHLAAVGLTPGRPIGTTGKGIRIGHLDTGYTEHPDVAGRYANNGWNEFDAGSWLGAREAFDRMNGWHPGHGTGTGSVILSVAPDAEILPIRVTNSVALFRQDHLVRGIRRAIAEKCDVISMSLGGPPDDRLRAAVEDATAAGIIIVAAAGNAVGTVSYPGGYSHVICPTAVNERDEPWFFGSKGTEIDLAAPGEGIYVATAAGGSRPERLVYGHGFGSGTSYAVAIVAGTAALWLSKHGKDRLAHRFGGKPFLAAAFKQMLVDCGVRPFRTVFRPGNYGRGVLSVPKFLATDPDAFAFTNGKTFAANRGFPKKRNLVGLDTDEAGFLDKFEPAYPIRKLITSAAARRGTLRSANAHLNREASLDTDLALNYLFQDNMTAHELTLLHEKLFYNHHFRRTVSNRISEAAFRRFMAANASPALMRAIEEERP